MSHAPTSLAIYLLGPPRLERNGQLVEVDTRKAIALLAYLALHPERLSRDHLAASLWPDYNQERAYANLRRTLWALNKALGQGWIMADNLSLELRRQESVWIDVVAFRRLLTQCAGHGHRSDKVCPACLEPLAQAVNLVRGDFLAGFSLRDSATFDDWCFFEAESIRKAVATSLAKLVQGHSRQQENETAITYARRWLAIDPLHEPAHRWLMQLYAQTGEQAAAVRQYQECVRILKAELNTPPEAETTTLYERIRTKQVGSHSQPSPVLIRPPIPSLTDKPAAPHNNLPKPATPFVGREAELAAILAHLHDPACRLLTLVGPGGMGKTRLALEAASRLFAEAGLVSDGVYFVALETLTTPDQIAPAIVAALGLPVASQGNPRRHLLGFLGEKRLLLVLDNFEHLLAGATLVTDILAAAPNVKLLVTARAALALQEEWFHPISGMDLPATNAHTLEAIQAASSVQLFVQGAQRARPGFTLAAESQHVVQLCRLVDGMPLALELAASWLRSLTGAEIVAELKNSLHLLTTSLRNVSPRHRSLQAVFDQSWQLLDEAERSTLCQFVVFEGGCDWAAAKAVTGVTAPRLNVLVERSWLQVREEGRYDLHPLVRSYLLDKFNTEYTLHTGESTSQVRDRHSRYYAALTINAAPKMGEREVGNLRAGWRHATQQLDVALLRYLDQATTGYNFFLGAEELLALTLTRAYNVLDDTMTTIEPTTLHQLIAWLLYVSSRTFDAAGQLQQAAHAAQRCLDYLARCPAAALDDEMRDGLLCQLAGILIAQGRLAEADEISESVLIRTQQADDQKHQIWTFYLLGMSATERGRYETANAYLHQSLAIQVMRQERYTLGVYTSLAEVAYLQGNYSLTAQMLNEAEASWGIELPLRLENQIQWARLEIAAWDLAAARARCLAVLHKACELAALGLQNAALNELGRIALLEQQLEEAGRFFAQASVYADKMEWCKGAARARIGLGHLALAQAKFAEAATHFHQAIAIAWPKGILPEVLGAIIGLAEVAAQAGRREQAVNWLRMAVEHSATPHHVRVQATQTLRAVTALQPNLIDTLRTSAPPTLAEVMAALETVTTG